ncbi:MAG: MBOAT family protein [Bacteroidetes bacterium]|nr:MBOAT family protein [Bacteroidota bacterium]
MLFNSLDYALFLPIVFILYWFVTNKSLRLQNIMLLTASYFFYGCWNWKFLFLLAFSTFLDYYTGIKIKDSESNRVRRVWLTISVVVNLGFLGLFKYYNFFAESFADLLQSIGFQAHFSTLSVILPVGISFYTFHGLSYVFDIYYDRIKPTRNWVDYSLFVSFFPLLVAGPIERATHLLPQVKAKRNFDYSKAIDGLRQILWGLFKKIVIADNCATYANMIFNHPSDYSGATMVLGALFFTFQIYCDFSGYSDIALGTARLLGFELLQNFAFPYFSRDIAEFWRRWHISLSSWFRDYVYIPLGGSKVGTWMKVRNIFVIFLLSGFWHGANWTFLVWGGLNALYFLPLLLSNRNRTHLQTVAQGKWFPSIKELLQMAITFGLTVFAWIFFRAASLTAALAYIESMFQGLFHKSAYINSINFLVWRMSWSLPIFIFLFIIIEWIGREQKYALEKLGLGWWRPIRWGLYYLILMSIYLWGGSEQQFIYFQF